VSNELEGRLDKLGWFLALAFRACPDRREGVPAPQRAKLALSNAKGHPRYGCSFARGFLPKQVVTAGFLSS
jgi:hypothetical protein